MWAELNKKTNDPELRMHADRLSEFKVLFSFFCLLFPILGASLSQFDTIFSFSFFFFLLQISGAKALTGWYKYIFTFSSSIFFHNS